VAGRVGSDFLSGRCRGIRATPAQEKSISFAQPRGPTKGYFCPHLVHQTACSRRRLGLSRASRRFAPHRHVPTGVEHFWQNRTFVASKHLRCTNVPLTLIQKVGPAYITPPAWNRGAHPAPCTASHGVRSHPVPVALVGAPATDLGYARLLHRLDTHAGPITIRLEMPGAFPSPQHR